MSQMSEKSEKDYVSETAYQAHPSAVSILAMTGPSAEVLSGADNDSVDSDTTVWMAEMKLTDWLID